MKTVFLYIQDTILRLTVIRLLLKVRCPYIESASSEEMRLKLGMAQDLGLLVEEYKDGPQGEILVRFLKDHKNLSQVPVLWLMPELRREWIVRAGLWKVRDVMPLPLEEDIFLRKLKGILSEDFAAGRGEDLQALYENPGYRQALLREALSKAHTGGYSLCVVRVSVASVTGDSPSFYGVLQHALRENDTILEMEPGDYILLCPYTPKANLIPLEGKIRRALECSEAYAESMMRLYLYGIAFPEDAKDPEALIRQLEEGMDSSRAASQKELSPPPGYQEKIRRYRHTGKKRGQL